MAVNPYVNKVIYNNGTIIDLTSDTVTPSKLKLGETAHDASGAPIVGTMPTATSTIIVTAPTGSTVVLTKPDSSTETGTEVSGTWTFSNLTALGTYSVTATLGSKTATESVVIDVVGTYSVTITYPVLPSDYQELSYIESTGIQYIVVDGTQYATSGKTYAFAIGSAHYLIPCYRKSDGEIGMYDTVTSTFFTNQGTGSFRMGAVIDDTFNASYQQVEYLESSGTQYIDTGVVSQPEIQASINFYRGSSSNSGTLIGSTNNSSKRLYVTVSNVYELATTNYYYSSATPATGRVVNIKVIFNNGDSKIYENNSSVISSSDTNIGNANNLFLLARNKGPSVDRILTCRIYDCKIISALTIARIFIPCYRKSDSVAGLYDMVNGVFYTNSGTGTFAVGADVDVA